MNNTNTNTNSLSIHNPLSSLLSSLTSQEIFLNPVDFLSPLALSFAVHDTPKFLDTLDTLPLSVQDLLLSHLITVPSPSLHSFTSPLPPLLYKDLFFDFPLNGPRFSLLSLQNFNPQKQISDSVNVVNVVEDEQGVDYKMNENWNEITELGALEGGKSGLVEMDENLEVESVSLEGEKQNDSGVGIVGLGDAGVGGTVEIGESEESGMVEEGGVTEGEGQNGCGTSKVLREEKIGHTTSANKRSDGDSTGLGGGRQKTGGREGVDERRRKELERRRKESDRIRKLDEARAGSQKRYREWNVIIAGSKGCFAYGADPFATGNSPASPKEAEQIARSRCQSKAARLANEPQKEQPLSLPELQQLEARQLVRDRCKHARARFFSKAHSRRKIVPEDGESNNDSCEPARGAPSPPLATSTLSQSRLAGGYGTRSQQQRSNTLDGVKGFGNVDHTCWGGSLLTGIEASATLLKLINLDTGVFATHVKTALTSSRSGYDMELFATALNPPRDPNGDADPSDPLGSIITYSSSAVREILSTLFTKERRCSAERCGFEATSNVEELHVLEFRDVLTTRVVDLGRLFNAELDNLPVEFCLNCQKNSIDVSLTVLSLPQVIILNLYPTQGGGRSIRTSLDNFFILSNSINQEYEIDSIILFDPRLLHYTSLVRRNGQWYSIDDSLVARYTPGAAVNNVRIIFAHSVNRVGSSSSPLNRTISSKPISTQPDLSTLPASAPSHATGSSSNSPSSLLSRTALTGSTASVPLSTLWAGPPNHSALPSVSKLPPLPSPIARLPSPKTSVLTSQPTSTSSNAGNDSHLATVDEESNLGRGKRVRRATTKFVETSEERVSEVKGVLDVDNGVEDMDWEGAGVEIGASRSRKVRPVTTGRGKKNGRGKRKSEQISADASRVQAPLGMEDGDQAMEDGTGEEEDLDEEDLMCEGAEGDVEETAGIDMGRAGETSRDYYRRVLLTSATSLFDRSGHKPAEAESLARQVLDGVATVKPPISKTASKALSDALNSALAHNERLLINCILPEMLILWEEICPQAFKNGVPITNPLPKDWSILFRIVIGHWNLPDGGKNSATVVDLINTGRLPKNTSFLWDMLPFRWPVSYTGTDLIGDFFDETALPIILDSVSLVCSFAAKMRIPIETIGGPVFEVVSEASGLQLHRLPISISWTAATPHEDDESIQNPNIWLMKSEGQRDGEGTTLSQSFHPSFFSGRWAHRYQALHQDSSNAFSEAFSPNSNPSLPLNYYETSYPNSPSNHRMITGQHVYGRGLQEEEREEEYDEEELERLDPITARQIAYYQKNHADNIAAYIGNNPHVSPNLQNSILQAVKRCMIDRGLWTRAHHQELLELDSSGSLSPAEKTELQVWLRKREKQRAWEAAHPAIMAARRAKAKAKRDLPANKKKAKDRMALPKTKEKVKARMALSKNKEKNRARIALPEYKKQKQKYDKDYNAIPENQEKKKKNHEAFKEKEKARNYKCSVCNPVKGFGSKATLKRHMLKFHPDHTP